MFSKPAATFLVLSAWATTAFALLGPAVNVDICLVTSTAAFTVAPPSDSVQAGYALAKNQTLNGAPWVPNCADAPTGTAEAECAACFLVADATFAYTTTGCAEASGICLFGYAECEAVCQAGAAYAFWSALRACYCANIDCSANGVSNTPGTVGPTAAIDTHHYVALANGVLAPANSAWNIADPLKAVTQCKYNALLLSAKTGYGWL